MDLGMTIDVPSVATTLAANRTQNDVGVAMLSKSLDVMEDSGQALIGMMDNSMELSVNPGVGGNFDMRV